MTSTVGVLGFRMWQPSVRNAEQYDLLAEERRISLRLLRPDRGRILDRAGKFVADSEQAYRITLVAELAWIARSQGSCAFVRAYPVAGWHKTDGEPDMRNERQSDCRPPLCAVIAGAVFLMVASPAAALFHDEPAVDLGRTVYAANCASCHGASLEGQPDWQSANEAGTYPAPPHDESGHTWHHGDAMLHDYVKRGGQAVLDGMGVNFTSGMPGFSDTLTDEEIDAVLDFIKSTWPERIRITQEERTLMESTNP